MSRACQTGKKKYHDAQDAKRALGNIRTRVGQGILKPTGTMPQRYYRCQFCGKFHLTHKDRK